MEEAWLQIAVPLILFVVMTCMGLELVPADFRRVVEIPKPVLIGLTGQILLLPCLGLLLTQLLGLPPRIAMGVVIITSCPGGAPSNLFTYMAGASLALSITLTALSSVITMVTIPLWINLGAQLFLGQEGPVRLPLALTFAQLLFVTLIPIGLGMLCRRRFPVWTERWRPPIKRTMAGLSTFVLVGIVAMQWETVSRDFSVSAWSALSLVVAALAMGFVLARGGRLGRSDAFTISVEVSLQNGALATLIVVNLLEDPALLIFPSCYALLAFLPVALWTLAYRARSPRVA